VQEFFNIRLILFLGSDGYLSDAAFDIVAPAAKRAYSITKGQLENGYTVASTAQVVVNSYISSYSSVFLILRLTLIRCLVIFLLVLQINDAMH